VPNIEAVAQDMNVDTPDVPDEFMNVAETAGGKRASETENDRIKKAARGNAVVSNFMEIVNEPRVTVPMIKQQFIMQGIDFRPKATREELAMIVDREGTKRWTDDVEEETVKKRLKAYKEEHGSLPLEDISTGKNTKQEPQKERKKEPQKEPQQQPQKEPQQQPQKEPQKELKQDPQKEQTKEADEDENINLKHQAPIVPPSRASLATLREHLIKAYNDGKITDQIDKDTWNRHKDFKEYMKIKDKILKATINKNLRSLYDKYVYQPAKKIRVKKTINKEKNKSK